MNILNTILNIVFPVNCIGCKTPKEELCINCISQIPLAERETAEWIYPIYDYRNPLIKKSLWLFKYQNNQNLAKIFAEILYSKIMEELSELNIFENFQRPILVPIPISKQRKHTRGYNQTNLICKELIKIDKKNNQNAILELEENILIKKQETKHQAHIKDRKHRLNNIIGSFDVKNSEKIKNRNIILIDDIITTGATLNEARKTLKKFGAKKIIAFTVAH